MQLGYCHRELLPVSEVVRPCQRFHDLGDFKSSISLYGEIVNRDRLSKLAGLQILRISTVGSISIFLFMGLFRRRRLRPRELGLRLTSSNVNVMNVHGRFATCAERGVSWPLTRRLAPPDLPTDGEGNSSSRDVEASRRCQLVNSTPQCGVHVILAI